jgi:hypothetical protein
VKISLKGEVKVHSSESVTKLGGKLATVNVHAAVHPFASMLLTVNVAESFQEGAV